MERRCTCAVGYQLVARIAIRSLPVECYKTNGWNQIITKVGADREACHDLFH